MAVSYNYIALYVYVLRVLRECLIAFANYTHACIVYKRHMTLHNTQLKTHILLTTTVQLRCNFTLTSSVLSSASI